MDVFSPVRIAATSRVANGPGNANSATGRSAGLVIPPPARRCERSHRDANAVAVDAVFGEHPGRDAFPLAEEREKEVLRADSLGAQGECLAERELERLLRAR